MAREDAVRRLVRLEGDITDAAAAVGTYPWDSDRAVVMLTSADLRKLLYGFLHGQFSAADCAMWADAVEGRDDVAYEPSHRDLLADFLHEVATPEIYGVLQWETAQGWLALLTSSTSGGGG